MTRLFPLAAGFLLFLYLAGCTSAPVPSPPYSQIQASIEAGDPQTALQIYRDYLKQYPDMPVDRLLLARLLLAAGFSDEARGQLTLLIDDSGPTVEMLLTLGYMERLSGNPEQEQQALEQALEIEANNSEVLAGLGTLYLEAEEYDRAAGFFQDALAADPLQPAALRGLGLVYLNQDNYQQSLEIFDRAVAADPENALNYADRARARAALKDRKAAVQDLSKAIDLDADFYWNYIDRGRHYLKLSMWAEAEGDFSRAIALDPEIFLAYVYRAGLYDRLDRGPEAVADYRRVLELNPEYTFAYAPLAVLLYIEEQWLPAAQAFEQAYSHEAEQPSYALLAALSWLQLDEQQRAGEYLSARLGDFPQKSWPDLIARYYLDPALETRTIAAANKEQNKLKQAQMLFYIASRLIMEDRIQTALRYLLLVKDIERRDLPEKRIARSLLSRFGYRD